MAWTQAQLDSLTAAIAEGVLSVMYQDRDGGIRRAQYRSLGDMLLLKRAMERELGVILDRPNRRLAQHDKGLT
jgi:monoamine oxidase